MANRTVIQTTQTKFSVEIFSGRSSKRHRNTDLDGNVSQFADFIKSSELAFPENDGGLFLKIEKMTIDY